MSRQAGKVRHYLSHFHIGNNGRHIQPQITIIKFVAGKGHLESYRKEKERVKKTLHAFIYINLKKTK